MYEQPPIIKTVSEQLHLSLPRASEDLEVTIINLDGLRIGLAEAIAQMHRFIYEKRKQMLWPKDADKGLTDLDRKIRLDGDLAAFESDYQFLQRLDNLVEQKITLATILLRH